MTFLFFDTITLHVKEKNVAVSTVVLGATKGGVFPYQWVGCKHYFLIVIFDLIQSQNMRHWIRKIFLSRNRDENWHVGTRVRFPYQRYSRTKIFHSNCFRLLFLWLKIKNIEVKRNILFYFKRNGSSHLNGKPSVIDTENIFYGIGFKTSFYLKILQYHIVYLLWKHVFDTNNWMLFKRRMTYSSISESYNLYTNLYCNKRLLLNNTNTEHAF